MALVSKTKNPHYDAGYNEQTAGEYGKSRRGRPEEYEHGAAQAHNIGQTRERAMYRAEDELLPRQGYSNLHDKIERKPR